MVTRKPVPHGNGAGSAGQSLPYPTTPTGAALPSFDLVEMQAAREREGGGERRGSDVSSHGTWDSEEDEDDEEDDDDRQKEKDAEKAN